MSEHITREYMEAQIGGIVDHIDEAWDRVAVLVVELGDDVHMQDAAVDLNLREMRDALAKMSMRLWREDRPAVLERYFPAQPGPDPDAQRDDAQDRAVREARGE
jgi:hypothetical protein